MAVDLLSGGERARQIKNIENKSNTKCFHPNCIVSVQ